MTATKPDRFWLLLNGDGSVAEQVTLPHHPCEAPQEGASAPYEWPLDLVIETDRLGDLEVETHDGQTWQSSLPALATMLCREIDLQRQREALACMPADPAITYAYQRKGIEARTFLSSFAAGGEDQATEFPWLAEEAQQLGITLRATAERISEAMEQSEQRLRKIHATAISAKATIREAASEEAMRQSAAINWAEI